MPRKPSSDAMTRTVEIRCLDCSWKGDTTKPNFRPTANVHAIREGHRVQLETLTIVVYSEKLNYPAKSHSRKQAA